MSNAARVVISCLVFFFSTTCNSADYSGDPVSGSSIEASEPSFTPCDSPDKDDLLVALTTGSSSGSFSTFGSFKTGIVEVNDIFFASYRDSAERMVIIQSLDQGCYWFLLHHATDTGPQPAALSVDEQGRVYAVYTNQKYEGRFLRFDPMDTSGSYALAVDRNVGMTNSKFALVYNPVYDLLHWSRRNKNADMEVITLDTGGFVVRTSVIASSVATLEGGYWDAHYQSLSVDPGGSVHLIYTPHYWPNKADPGTYTRAAVLYLRSDDAGDTWKLSDGTLVQTPFATNDFDNGGELISVEKTAYGVNLLATDDVVHIVYWTYDPIVETRYVRLDRATGNEQQRNLLEVNYHSILIDDPETGLLYLAGEGPDGKPTLYRSTDGGDNWNLFKTFNMLDAEHSWNFSTGFSKLASSRFVILLSSYLDQSGDSDAFFLRYSVRSE